ncbi:MAG: hypothetical protein ABIW82_11615 [Dokdonella sp.]
MKAIARHGPAAQAEFALKGGCGKACGVTRCRIWQEGEEVRDQFGHLFVDVLFDTGARLVSFANVLSSAIPVHPHPGVDIVCVGTRGFNGHGEFLAWNAQFDRPLLNVFPIVAVDQYQATRGIDLILGFQFRLAPHIHGLDMGIGRPTPGLSDRGNPRLPAVAAKHPTRYRCPAKRTATR